ncbi:MAG: NTP transferase domain-containing protein [Actinomycetota bacterium]|nr:NTP transferase domain-containing protein [Actinomycetota bacterium]
MVSQAAVVLAAGGGSRWDGDGHKLLVEVDGRPLAAHALAAAADAGLDELVVVTGAADLTGVLAEVLDEVLPVGVTVLHNDQWAEGQAGSLGLAVTHAAAVGHDAVVVGLADSPGIPTEAWQAVAAVEAELAVATFAGRRRPPTLIGRSLWGQLPEAGDQGARGLLDEWPDLVVEVPCFGDPTDVDTMEDLRRWT